MAREKKPVVAMRWLAEGREDEFADYCDRKREDLPLADLSDDELGNYAYLYYDRSQEEELAVMMTQLDENPKHVTKIAFMTAVKERLRWLSRQLAIAQGIYPGRNPVIEGELDLNLDQLRSTTAGGYLSGLSALLVDEHESRSAKDLLKQPGLAHSEYFHNLQKELGKAALDRMPEGLKKLAETVAPEFRHRKYALLHNNNLEHLLKHFGYKNNDLLNELRYEELVKKIASLWSGTNPQVIRAALGRPNTTGLIAFDAYVCVCVDLLMDSGVYIPFCGDVIGLTGTDNQSFIVESKFHPSGIHVNYPAGRVPDPLDAIQLVGESELRLYGSYEKPLPGREIDPRFVGVGEVIQMEPRPLDYDKTNAHSKWFEEFGQLSEKLGVNSMVANVPQLASRCERLIKLVPACGADMTTYHLTVRVALGLTNDSYLDRMSALREVVRRVNEGIAISHKNVQEFFGEEWKEEDPIDTMSKTVMPTKGIGSNGNEDGGK